MKMVKNIIAVCFAASLMFGGVSFHMSNVYTDMDGTTAVNDGFGATWAINENTSLGYDTNLGMIFSFDVPAGVSLRLSTHTVGDPADTSTGVGLGYTWWTGGTGLKTSISTSYDMVTNNDGKDGTGADVDPMGKLALTVGFGF